MNKPDHGYGSDGVAWTQAKEALKYMPPCENQPAEEIFIPEAGITIRCRAKRERSGHDGELLGMWTPPRPPIIGYRWTCSCGAEGSHLHRMKAVDEAFDHAQANHSMDQDDHRAPLLDDGDRESYRRYGKPYGW